MTKPQTQFFVTLGILIVILGVAGLTFTMHNQGRAQVFTATIHPNCAPWDGAAFTVSIPMSAGSVIDISIWKSPDIKVPVTFSFPDNTGQVGNASYRSASDKYEPLNGTVFFPSVEAGSQVEGRFELITEAGQQFKGQFEAQWSDVVMMCG